MLSLQGLEKRFGAIRAVAGVDLEVGTGEAFALLGANGSGKSTILRAVAGLHRPDGGSIRIDGVDALQEPVRARRRLSYLPQRAAFPGLLSGREVLELYAGLKGVGRGKVDGVLEDLRLGPDADRAVREYSGGMIQRLALAITCLDNVPLLLLDEPTLNLDPEGAAAFHEWIHERRQAGATVLFSSHLLHEALHLADRVGILADGRLVSVEALPIFRERVLRETRVRVVLDQRSEAVAGAARSAGAEEDGWDETSYEFRSPPRERLRVIRAIEEAGGLIEELHTEAPRWDSLVTNGENGS